MKYFLFIFLISTSLFAEVPIPRAATGLEAGVARLSDGNKTVTGTSWMYVFEYQPDNDSVLLVRQVHQLVKKIRTGSR